MWVSRQTISHSPPQIHWLIVSLSVSAREERRDHRDSSREAGQSHKVRAMSTLLFPVLRPVSRCSCQRGQAEKTGSPAKTDVLTELTCTGHRPFFSERRGGPFPLFWLKQRRWGRLRKTGCRCKQDQIQSDLHPDKVFSLHFNTCEILQQHKKLINSSIPPPPPLLYYGKTDANVEAWNVFQVASGHYSR